MAVLSGLKPEKVFEYFEKLCSVPHGSGNTKIISDMCVGFAKELGLRCRQEPCNNVIIWKDASAGYENAAPIILQGHIDMVCAKTDDCTKDMAVEGLDLVTDGEWVWADKTSLGGDNGIAVAMILAILADDTLAHPPIEAVFTVDEEVGMDGAFALDCSDLKGRKLLNLDSELEGVFTVSCAGGMRADCHLPGAMEPVSGMNGYAVTLSGLQGGHSGTEIHKGRANAIALLGRWLTLLTENGVDYTVLTLSGGAKENVIPKESSVTLVLPTGITEGVRAAAAQFAAQMKAEYGTADPEICLQLTEQGCGGYQALDGASAQRLRKALLLMPWGVQAMSMDVPGLVETSLNLGVAELDDSEAILRFSLRSSVPSAKELLSCKLQTLTELLGGTVRFHGDYPAWTYARESALRDRCVAMYEAQYGAKPQIVAIHAGLECGILSGKIDGLDCISFGPNLLHVHTPHERADIASVARVWEYLKAILAYKE